MENKSHYIEAVIRIALATGMRSGEIRHLRLERIDLANRELRVGNAKTPAGEGRGIPMNDGLYAAVAKQIDWLIKTFGKPQPRWYLFPFCDRVKPIDPTRPVTTVKSAWESVRKLAGVNIRFHDLRHTVGTKFAENGTPEATMKALMGHMSRAMLERYSHIRNEAKRAAVVALDIASPIPVIREGDNGKKNGVLQESLQVKKPRLQRVG
jgi:integrase